jgi:tetratricopeptide (TPR) repeat protein
MLRTFYPFIGILLLFITIATCTVQVMGQVTAVGVLVDDDYDRYKKRADDSFMAGDYHNALRQYHNCLAVPGFETDPYARKKISESTTCSNLSLQAETALKQSKGLEAISLFDKLLAVNPDDGHTKGQVVDYFENKGDELFDNKKYVDARTIYEKAISYAAGQKKIDLSNKLTNVNKLRATSQRLKLQMATGIVAAGAAIYALVLRSDYVVKKNTLDQISLGAENPALPGTIDNADTYSRYKVAYADAQAAGKKQGLYVACVGLAAVATLAEVYLLRNSSKRAKKMVTWKPSSQSVGLAVSYTF